MSNSHPRLLSREQVRGIDQRATSEFNIPSLLLMENAGRACAELILKLNPQREPVSIFCGPGNNGGDGYVVARHLDCAGMPVRAINLGVSDSAQDAVVNFKIATAMRLVGTPFEVGWCVDALFGTGLSRPIAEPFDSIVQSFGRYSSVLSLDIPSGLDCDTGTPTGACVRADHTATFVAMKLGFSNPASMPFTGQIHVLDIGIPRVLLHDYL